MLSFYIGERVSWTSVADITLDAGSYPSYTMQIQRPELSLFEAQRRQVEAQKKRLLVKGMPQFGLFAQGAYANPGLNMFNAGFTPYFIGGASFSWNFGGLYSFGDEKKTLSVMREKIDVQEENFRFMLNQQLVARNSEINRLQKLILRDSEIVSLTEEIVRMSEIKRDNGTLSVSDYIQDLNTLDISRQTKAIHEIELLKLQDQITFAINCGLKVNAGHGLNYRNIKRVAELKGIEEFNIGHSIVSRAALVGMEKAVKDMLELIN